MIIEQYSAVPQHALAAMRDIWNNVYPACIAADELRFQAWIGALEEPFFLLLWDNNKQELLGWCCAFLRQGMRWFTVLIDESAQGKGIGTKLMQELMSRYNALSGWVVDTDQYTTLKGIPYRSPLEFYRKLGFLIHPNIVFPDPKLRAICTTWQKKTEGIPQ
jgi:GNAT superfamily N-acetyltransferase